MRLKTPDPRSPAWILIGRALSTLLAFITGPLIARSIGPEGRGETALVVALIFLLPVLGSVGLPFQIRRSWSLGNGGADSRAARLWVLICLVPAGIVGIVLYLTLFAGFDPDARLMAAIAVAAVPAALSWMCDNGALIATHRFLGVFVLQILQPAASVIGVATLWIVGRASAASVIGVYTAGTILTCVAGLVLVRLGGHSRTPLIPLLRKSIPYWGSSAAEAAANRADQVLALPLMGSGPAGLYSVAVSLGTLPLAFGHALSGSYFSSIARLPAAGANSPTASLLREGLLVGLACAVLGSLAAPVLIPVLFGQEFEGAIAPAWLLFASAPFAIFIFAATQVLGARGDGTSMTVLQVVYFAVITCLFTAMSSSLGVFGGGLASFLSAVIVAIVAAVMVRVPIQGLLPRWSDLRAVFDTLRKGRK